MLGQAAALLRPAMAPPLALPPTLCSGQSFLLPQPAGRPIAAIDDASERLLLVPTQLPLGVQVASVPAGLVTRRSDERISVIVMPTGHMMLADVMALPAVLADAAAAAAAAGHQMPSRSEPQPPSSPSPSESESLVKMEAADDEAGDEDDDLPMSVSDELNCSQIQSQQNHESIVDGVDLNEIGQFAREFKLRRLRLGLTQTQIGAALSAAKGPAYSQSAISRFEKLDVTPRSAARIKQALQTWLTEAEESASAAEEAAAVAAAAAVVAASTTAAVAEDDDEEDDDHEGAPAPAESAAPASAGSVTDGGVGKRPRKRRTSFTPEALEALNGYFELNQHPSGAEVTQLARVLHYSREVVRVWFCNRRQALRANTVKRLRPPTAPGAHVVSAAAAAAVAAAAAAVAAPASSPSPSDSPVNLSQHTSSSAHHVATTMPLASPNSESSAPTPPRLLP